MVDNDALQATVDRNFEAFKKRLPTLLQTQAGRFALMRDGEPIEFFDSARDAIIYGQKEYPDRLFSVQQVTSKVMDLGYFSYALLHKPI